MADIRPTKGWQERLYRLIESLLYSDSSSLRVSDAFSSGEWGYYSGVSGTVSVASTDRVLMVSALNDTVDVDATVAIDGGPSILLPPGASFTFEPKGTLMAPSIVFTGTTSYMVEVVR